MKQERQYAVEVLEKWQHGKYGKRFYFGLYVPGFNKADAEAVAEEVVAGMNFYELNSRCVDPEKDKPWTVWHEAEQKRRNGENAPIGFDFTGKFFTFKAYIEK